MKTKSEKRINERLKKMGDDILAHIEKKENPNLEIPLRTLSNVIFDKNTHTLRLGDKASKRYFFNVAHSKKFMQTLMVAAFCKSLRAEDIHASIREMYYSLKRTLSESKENTFDEQSESDPVIIDLEVALDVIRENLHLTADRRGSVAGNGSIVDRGDTIDWSKLGSGGWSIPSTTNEIGINKMNADFVLVIEKNAAFDRLNEDKFWKKHKCILIGTQGQPSRGARLLIQRLNQEAKLPVYVMTDADSYGFYIYSVIKSGSIGLAHVSDRISTPAAKFIGLTMSDIYDFDLKNVTIKARERDIKRAKELMNYEWFKKPEWQRELKLMIKKGVKAEIEALANKSLKFLTEDYLPEKIKNKEFLD
ncbi:DNA topoisomerase IV subunit A [Candidatus Aenigmatarchaeota archaeon]